MKYKTLQSAHEADKIDLEKRLALLLASGNPFHSVEITYIRDALNTKKH